MTEIGFSRLIDWLEDDRDDSLDIIDMVSEFSEMLGVIVPDDDAVLVTAEELAVPAKVAVAAGAVAAFDEGSQSWGSPGLVEEVPAKKKSKSAEFFDKAEQVVNEWTEEGFGIREDSHPLEIFDILAEGIDPDN